VISGGEGIAPMAQPQFHKIEKRISRSVLASLFFSFFFKRILQIRFTKTKNGFQFSFCCFVVFNECVFSLKWMLKSVSKKCETNLKIRFIKFSKIFSETDVEIRFTLL